jgi:hypothetical protein
VKHSVALQRLFIEHMGYSSFYKKAYKLIEFFDLDYDLFPNLAKRVIKNRCKTSVGCHLFN